MAETRKEKSKRRLALLTNERASWIAHWKDINQFLLPRRGRFMLSDVNRGDKRNNKIIDSEASQALNTLVSGMMSGMTSPTRRWFRLATPDIEMMEFGPVKKWLHLAESKIYQVFAQSNLYQVLPYVYEEMAAYGTAAMIQLDDYNTVSRFQVFSAGEYCIAQNYKYRVDTIYREIPLTVEQIVTRYGLDNVSDKVKTAWDNGNYDVWIDVVHVIEPNHLDRDMDSPLSKDMAFLSYTYEAGSSGDKFLEESGFPRFPVYAPRWHLMPPDVYGRGPGMDALGDIKQLQDQQKKKGQAISKHVNPPMVAPSSLKNQRMSTIPGDVTFVDANSGQQSFTPAYQVKPQLGEFLADMQDVRARINKAFYADLFLMMSRSDRRQITATEIGERREEKLLVLGPVLSRISHDLLDPLIDGTFDRLIEAGVLPPAPPELQDQDLKVEYISIMAMAQKAQGIVGIRDTAGFVGNLAGINPDVIDKMDFDQAVDEYSDMRGVPPSIIRSDDAVAAIRAKRAETQQAAVQVRMAQEAAHGAKTLSETDTGGDNMLSDIMGGIQ
jgi:hypothetical protein